ncbi:MAG: hypothetical protein H7A01_17920 [Hahellaceae bacterium]|nr:hypothetical protein [Hahellaceae bacterium]MCP5212186.1 hypothetical protein [Hahellaceae bacterium]
MNLIGKKSVLLFGGVAISSSVLGDITSLDDATMASVTGQAGITVEINSAELTIGEIRYQDKGSIAVRDIRVGGADRTNFFDNQWIPTSAKSDKLDNLKIDIDILADGDFVAIMKPAGTHSVVDFGISTGEWLLQSSAGVDGTRLINSLDITGLGIDARLRIDNQTSHTFIESTWGVDDLDVDFGFLGVRVANMKIAGSNYFETLGTWGAGSAGILDIGAELDLEIYTAIAHGGHTALGLNLTKFEADVLIPEIYLGSQPSIGAISLNNVSVTAETVIYGH